MGTRSCADAVSAGPAASMVARGAGRRRGRNGHGRRRVIEVDDTTAALQDLARDVRRRSGAKVVAITGSAGKTTTKEIAAEFLGGAVSRCFGTRGT